MTQEERDLLIRIDEKLAIIIDKVDDHDKRIKWNEKFNWMILGGFILVQFIFKIYK